MLRIVQFSLIDFLPKFKKKLISSVKLRWFIEILQCWVSFIQKKSFQLW